MTSPNGAETAEAAELAGRLRRLAGLLATCEPSGPEQDEVGRLLDRALAVVDPDGSGAALGPSTFARHLAGQPDALDRSLHHPLAAGRSAVHPPFEIAVDPEADRLVATGTYHAAWEGPPGLVHGGFLATALDLALSTLANASGRRAVTRRLALRYLRPVPLDREVRIEVVRGRLEGRLLDLTGILTVDGRAAVRVSAQFATLPTERFGRPAEG